MKITILGTGNMGSGLASALVAAGHDISIGARDPVKAVALAEMLGHGVVGADIATASKVLRPRHTGAAIRCHRRGHYPDR